MVPVKMPRFFYSIPVLLFFLITGCIEIDKSTRYLTEDMENKQELEELLTLLEESGDSPESRFVVLQQIIKILHRENTIEETNLFLTTHVEQYPEDPFNSYYLFIVAQNYLEQEAGPFAVHYYERILRNYPDLLVHGRSIHLNCLRKLISLSSNPELKAGYYKELLSRFRDEVNPGYTYYNLGKTYEELGEWDLAMQAYINFLKFPDTKIPGTPNAYTETKKMVALTTVSNAYWMKDSLDQLIDTIKWAIYNGRSDVLVNLMSKTEFFATAWEQKENTSDEPMRFNIALFLTPRIWYSQTIDQDSNAKEAYLRTTGWSYRISTWYLYFRKIFFPADPELHGKWEWAGIYFGEKPFTGSTDNL
jgi:tetratricopeptide (TPR) repeat protein